MIVRQPLRDQIYENLLASIEKGSYRPGQRLSDVNVANGLRVSRTPVREAFLRLEQEGLVTTEPGYGFAVRPLSAQEIHDKYPILASLECLALKTSPLPDETQLKRLISLNGAMERLSGNERRLADLDEEWHLLLLANCENRSLLDMIAGLKTNLRRYELAYMRDARGMSISTEHHSQIIQTLANGDLDAALGWLERNWTETAGQLAEWLVNAQANN